MKAYSYTVDNLGVNYKEVSIPEDMIELSNKYHNKTIRKLG